MRMKRCCRPPTRKCTSGSRWVTTTTAHMRRSCSRTFTRFLASQIPQRTFWPSRSRYFSRRRRRRGKCTSRTRWPQMWPPRKTTLKATERTIVRRLSSYPGCPIQKTERSWRLLFASYRNRPKEQPRPNAYCWFILVSYFLASKRLSFREWSTEDVPLAISLWGDPKVTALIGGPSSPEQARQRLHREIALCASSRVQYWPVFLTSTHGFFGCCGLRPYGPKERVLELGFHVLSSQWGKGFATEAARAVIAHAFATFDARALFAGHHPN